VLARTGYDVDVVVTGMKLMIRMYTSEIAVGFRRVFSSDMRLLCVYNLFDNLTIR